MVNNISGLITQVFILRTQLFLRKKAGKFASMKEELGKKKKKKYDLILIETVTSFLFISLGKFGFHKYILENIHVYEKNI